MSDPDQVIAKIKLPVEIERDDGTIQMGFVFVSPQGRLSDAMNDNRPFLPFETSSGKFCLLRKDSALSITPLNQDRVVYSGNDPFRILGVDEECTVADLRKAYVKLSVDHHPDKLKGLGLAAEFIELANIRMARINEAFQRAMKIRTFAEQEDARQNSATGDGAQ